MPATTVTRELFPKSGTTKNDIEQLAILRLKAGAITSKVESEDDNWVIVTTWNVFGEQ